MLNILSSKSTTFSLKSCLDSPAGRFPGTLVSRAEVEGLANRQGGVMNVVLAVVHCLATVLFLKDCAVIRPVQNFAVDRGVAEALVADYFRNVVQPDPGLPSTRTISQVLQRL